ncbi:MAG: hypothetical protein ACI867_002336 [Glaciecola sp.]|jgi:hypothetical protein
MTDKTEADPTPSPDTTQPSEPTSAAQAAGPDEPETSTELQPAGKGAPRQSGPPPPRRTGVFLDPADLRAHVGELLRTMLGGYEVDAAGNFTFVHDTARIFITFGASPVGPTVGVFSITNLEVDFSEELGKFLLVNNHKMAFGAFSYDQDNRSIWLRHTLLGTMLDGPELQAALIAIAQTAAQFDDPIREQFGGRAFHDAPADVQQRTRPPEPSDIDAGDTTNASGYL